MIVVVCCFEHTLEVDVRDPQQEGTWFPQMPEAPLIMKFVFISTTNQVAVCNVKELVV